MEKSESKQKYETDNIVRKEGEPNLIFPLIKS